VDNQRATKQRREIFRKPRRVSKSRPSINTQRKSSFLGENENQAMVRALEMPHRAPNRQSVFKPVAVSGCVELTKKMELALAIKKRRGPYSGYEEVAAALT